MMASGEGPATGSAPQRQGGRFGPDLWPRVAAAAVMGAVALAAAWIGGFVFAAFWWLASIVVLWEWQRLVGGERLIFQRVGVGAVALALAALSALHNSIPGVAAALILGAAAVGWIGRTAAGRSGRLRACSMPARSSPASGCSGCLRASAWPRSCGFSRSFGERTSPPISPAG